MDRPHARRWVFGAGQGQAVARTLLKALGRLRFGEDGVNAQSTGYRPAKHGVVILERDGTLCCLVKDRGPV